VSLADSLGATVGPPQTVTNLAAGGTQAVSFGWTPTEAGTHTLTGTAATVSGETETADNVGTASAVVNPVPVHDVAVTNVTAPSPVTVNEAQTVTVTVANQGTLGETFQVSLADSLGATVGPPQTVTNLAAGGTQAVIFAWTPTEAGTHTLTGTAATVSGETETADNVGTVSAVVNPAPMTVTSITPNTTGVGTSVVVLVTGGNFAPGAALSFVNGTGPAPTASNVVVLDSGNISATVTTKSGGPSRNRVWDVVVANPDGGRGVLAKAFTITP
jgi:hypothetical protein